MSLHKSWTIMDAGKPISHPVTVANDQPLRQCIADLPDANLQGAAIGHEARRMKPDRIFGIAVRLGRRRKQRKIRRGTARTAENSSAGRPAPGMNGSSELTWPISLNDARPWRRARRMSSVVSVLQLRL